MARSDRLLISVEDDQDLLHSPLHPKRVTVEKGLEIEIAEVECPGLMQCSKEYGGKHLTN